MVATTICSVSPFPQNVKLLNFHYSDSIPVIKKFQNKCNTDHTKITSTRRNKWNRVLKSSSSSSSNSITNVVATSELKLELESASNVVRKFYGGINGRDLSSVEALIADNCVYEDLIFPQPFVGRKAILEFFEKFNDSINEDLQFVIDDISTEDSIAVGVTWHLEWKGKPFPFSKGCSFYKLEVVNGQRKITYGRDSVEPAIKPGETALRPETSAGFVSVLAGLKLKQLKTQNHASRNKLLDSALELSVNSSQKMHIREDKDNLKKSRDEYMDCPVSAYAFAY